MSFLSSIFEEQIKTQRPTKQFIEHAEYVYSSFREDDRVQKVWFRYIRGAKRKRFSQTVERIGDILSGANFNTNVVTPAIALREPSPMQKLANLYFDLRHQELQKSRHPHGLVMIVQCNERLICSTSLCHPMDQFNRLIARYYCIKSAMCLFDALTCTGHTTKPYYGNMNANRLAPTTVYVTLPGEPDSINVELDINHESAAAVEILLTNQNWTLPLNAKARGTASALYADVRRQLDKVGVAPAACS